MSRSARNKRSLVVLLGCLLVGSGINLAGGGLAWIEEAADTGAWKLLGIGLVVAVSCVLTGVMIFLPYGFVALGWMRLGDYRKHELADLDDSNTVGDPVAGERKYQEWLSAVNSPEAFLGMVPRSEDYVPPEHRPPPDAKLPRTRLSNAGWNAFGIVLLLGAIGGGVLGWWNGLGDGGKHAQGVLQLVMAAIVGSVLVLPVAAVVALLFGRIEQEEDDDAGAGGPETA
ncbi:MAG: hypothetical protein KDB82_01855 [Planctomycetes bacterium]|nr:hypothetical protein [Planctomycetota bacterium]